MKILSFIIIIVSFCFTSYSQNTNWAKIDLVGIWETDFYLYPSGLKEYRSSEQKVIMAISININAPFGLESQVIGPDGTKKEGMLWINYRNELCIGKDYNYAGIGDEWGFYFDRRGIKSIKIKLENLPGKPWAHYKKIR